MVARCDVFEEELKQLKVKLRQTERELEELKVDCGIVDEKNEDEEDKVRIWSHKDHLSLSRVTRGYLNYFIVFLFAERWRCSPSRDKSRNLK